jgi:hypothetical protein
VINLKYAIVYEPTNEYVSFFDNGKAILFTDSEEKAQEELAEILVSDGGVDEHPEDFIIELVDVDTDGGEFVTKDDYFVSKDLIKG